MRESLTKMELWGILTRDEGFFSSERQPMGSKRIYVVEDDRAMLALLLDFLAMQGYETRGFHLASEALTALKTHFQINQGELPTDLIISDINMPQMTGIELVSAVKSIYDDLPVILISAFGTSGTQSAAESAGAFRYLNKPFRLSDLSEALGQVWTPA